MKVFLSWSGERAKAMAQALRTWLPDVIQAVQPWMSDHDIGKGGRGLREIADELAECNFGILCITSENQNSQWVNFEAGALSKSVDGAVVVPLLLDLKVADLTGPMTQFQATESSVKSDVSKLMLDLNSAQGDSGIAPDRVIRIFDRLWPDLDAELAKIRASSASGRSSGRSNADMLSEMLVLMRHQERRIAQIETLVASSARRYQGFSLAPAPARPTGPVVTNSPVSPEEVPQTSRRRGGGLEGMVLAELQQVASGLGIRGVARMRKSQIIEAIRDVQSGSPD